MARAISITPGAKTGNRDDAYSVRTSPSDQAQSVSVWVSNSYGVATRHEVARELVRLADYIDSQQVSGWPL